MLKKYGVTAFQPLDIWHPRFYNFQTDELDFQIEVADDFEVRMRENVARFKAEDDGTMQAYINNHWKTRDGFWSHMPESFDEIITPEKYSCHIEQRVGAYLTLCLLKEGWTLDKFYESADDIFEELTCNGWDVWQDAPVAVAA